MKVVPYCEWSGFGRDRAKNEDRILRTLDTWFDVADHILIVTQAGNLAYLHDWAFDTQAMGEGKIQLGIKVAKPLFFEGNFWDWVAWHHGVLKEIVDVSPLWHPVVLDCETALKGTEKDPGFYVTGQWCPAPRPSEAERNEYVFGEIARMPLDNKPIELYDVQPLPNTQAVPNREQLTTRLVQALHRAAPKARYITGFTCNPKAAADEAEQSRRFAMHQIVGAERCRPILDIALTPTPKRWSVEGAVEYAERYGYQEAVMWGAANDMPELGREVAKVLGR